MANILSRATSMKVNEITNDMVITPNQVYVMPENVGLSIENNTLKILSINEDQCRRLPIDHFFQGLAKNSKNNAVGVILSGSASDGSLGLIAINEVGGITFAQSEDSAEYKSMPENAIATGCVDFVCPPLEIAEKLISISRHPYSKNTEIDKLLSTDNDSFAQILKALQKISGINFANYKLATIQRRIVRRMVLNKFESLKDYANRLEQNQEETQALMQDVLIHVTQFFRDPEVFETLKKDVFPLLVQNKPEGSPLRMWVVGCATGEETYSIAIALFEFLGDRSNDFPIQIFATDANDFCIETARQGTYKQGLKFNVSSERLRRFFVKTDEGYQIIKSIRDICIFAKQNVLSDPPYSKMDFISCRNLLIYFDPILQKKVLPTFHYALKADGFLLLGKSESVISLSNLFHLNDKKSKIYSKKITDSKNNLNFDPAHSPSGQFPYQRLKTTQLKSPDIFKEADRAILMKYEHAGVVINESMEILQFRGDTSPFLNNSPGTPSINLFKMAREGLGIELHGLVEKVRSEKYTSQKKITQIKYREKLREVSIEIEPLRFPSNEHYFLVLFFMKSIKTEAIDVIAETDPHVKLSPEELRNKELREELASTKVYLNSIIEDREAINRELQSSNEESQSSNEEFQSMNEELQSTNEELETAKEELQATNEEIMTVNDELHFRFSEVDNLNNDLQNLLTSINLSVIMVDTQLRIRRYTRSAEKNFHLMIQKNLKGLMVVHRTRLKTSNTGSCFHIFL